MRVEQIVVKTGRYITFFCLLSTLYYPLSAYSEVTFPEGKGLAIMEEADRRDSGFGNNTVNLIMTLTTPGSKPVNRHIRQMTLEQEDDGDKSIMVFDRPKDLKGTAILTYTHKVGNDDQWLYLTALKRVKKIASDNRSGPFMGSEFAFEDISSQEIEKYSYRYLRDELVNGIPCFVVERIPVEENSGYTRQNVWIDTSEYRLIKVDYYDRKNELLKTMDLDGYQLFLGKYWRPGTMAMKNHQTGKSTILSYEQYVFNAGLKESNFTKAALSRIR